jgi:hypothetical protein
MRLYSVDAKQGGRRVKNTHFRVTTTKLIVHVQKINVFGRREQSGILQL